MNASPLGRPLALARPLLLLVAGLAVGAWACSSPGNGGVTGGGSGLDGVGFADGAGGGGDAASVDAAGADAPGADTASVCAACAAPAVCIDGYCVAPTPGGCTPGAVDGCYLKARLVCDATGTAYVPQDCSPTQQCIGGQCVAGSLCQPGVTVCEGLAAKKTCNPEGTAFEEPVACPDSQYCSSGKCGSSCNIDPKFGSYVGCSFWTVDLPNWPDPTMNPTPEDRPYAVVISNPGELDAEITFEAAPGFPITLADNLIPGGQTRVYEMPVMNVQGNGVSPKGVRLSSTRPILVHQFQPWQAIYSNDASLLLPETFLGSDYVIMSWPTDARGLIQLPIPGMPVMPNVNSFFTVVATEDDTDVTFQVTARVEGGGAVQPMATMGIQTITLHRGDVLNVQSDPETLFESSDLTGSTVSANKPIAVFAGQESAGIAPANYSGESSCCLDHLEEQMLPMAVLGNEYQCVKSKPRGGDVDIWRIQAAEPNVTITTDPPQAGANGVTLTRKGDWVQIETAEPFTVTGTGKLQVGQYLVGGQTTDAFIGDPSLMLAVPSERYRTLYAVTVPQGYAHNYVTLIKKVGATVSSAAGPVPQADFAPVPGGVWEYAYVELTAGFHKIAGDQPFGLIAYGFNSAVSYGYTGGMTAPGE